MINNGILYCKNFCLLFCFKMSLFYFHMTYLYLQFFFLIFEQCTCESMHSFQLCHCFCMPNNLFVELICMFNILHVYCARSASFLLLNCIAKLTYKVNSIQVELARQYHFNYTTPDRSRQELLLNKTPLPTEHWPFLRLVTFYLLYR